MDIVLIVLIIVICYKAKNGELEKGLIKGTKIIGYIYLPFSIILITIALLILNEMKVILIISLLFTVALLIIIIKLKTIAEHIMYKEDDWFN